MTERNLLELIAKGDGWRLIVSVTDIPSGLTLTKGWLTVKRYKDDADADALFQRTVTTVLDTHGQITDTGGDGAGSLYFLIPLTSTASAEPSRRYEYDVQVLTSDGQPATVFIGKISFKQGVTDANS
jgi:hypothetical protein